MTRETRRTLLRSRSRNLGRSLSGTRQLSFTRQLPSTSPDRRARFQEEAASGSFKRRSFSRSVSRGCSPGGRSSEQEPDLSGRSEGGEDLSGHNPEPAPQSSCSTAAAKLLAQEHFWQHKSKYEGRLRAEEEEKAQLLKRDPLHFARRATETDGLGYGIEHINAHVSETLESKRKLEDSLPCINSRGRSNNGVSPLVEGWLGFLQKEEAAKKIQVAWRRSWRRRHGIPSPLPLSSDSEDERPARWRVQRRSSTTNTRLMLQTRRSGNSDRASRVGETTRSSMSGEEVLLQRKPGSIGSPMASSKLRNPSKSTDVSKTPRPSKGVLQKRASMSGAFRPSLSQSLEGGALSRRAQQQQQQQQGSGEGAAQPKQAWRLESWDDACEQGESIGERPTSGGRAFSLDVHDMIRDMPTAFNSSDAQLSSDGCFDMGGQRHHGVPNQATSPYEHSAMMAGVDGNYAGGGREAYAAGDALSLTSGRDSLLAELAAQGSAKRRPPPKSQTFHHMGKKGGQPWGHILRAHPQPVQRPVLHLAVESNTAMPQLPRCKSALALLTVEGSKPPAPGTQHSLSPSNLNSRSLPELITSLSTPTGGFTIGNTYGGGADTNTNTNPTTHTHAPSLTINSTHASFDVYEPSSPSRPRSGCLTAFMPGPPLHPSPTSTLPSRPSTATGHSKPYSVQYPRYPSDISIGSGIQLQPRQRASAKHLSSKSSYNLREVFGAATPPQQSTAGPSAQLSALPPCARTEHASKCNWPGSAFGNNAEWKEPPAAESNGLSSPTGLTHAPQLRTHAHQHQPHARTHRQSLPDLDDLSGKGAHIPKPPSGSPSAEQSFLGRIMEQKLRGGKPLKQVPSPLSPSSSGGVDSGALSLALQGKRFSNVVRSSSVLGSPPEQECSKPGSGRYRLDPLQALVKDDADEGGEQHRPRSSRSSINTPFSSTAAHPASPSAASSVHSQLSRRFSSNELDPLHSKDASRRQSSASVNLSDSILANNPNITSRRQSSNSVNVGDNALVYKNPSTQQPLQQYDTAIYGSSLPMQSNLSGPDAFQAMRSKRASSGDGGQRLPVMPSSSFSKATLAPRPSLSRRSSSTAVAGGHGQPSDADAWLQPTASQYSRRSTESAAVGRGTQAAGVDDKPTAGRGKRRVSFVEGVPYSAAVAAAATAAAAGAETGSDPPAESLQAAIPPQLARSSSMGKRSPEQ